MRDFLARRPSPAMAVAFVALLAALSGTAIALPGTNSVDSGDIKNNVVRSKDIRNSNVRSGDIRNGTVTGTDVRNDSLTGADINESTLGMVPSANTANSASTANTANTANSAANVDKLKTVGGFKLVSASASNADQATARAAASEVPLYSAGPLSFYGKCYVDTDFNGVGLPATIAETFARTSANGSILEADDSNLPGDPFLDSNTPEEDRDMTEASSPTNGAETDADDNAAFGAAAPGGTSVSGQANVAAKQGDVTGGNGIYGDGNSCVFWGELITG